jgi:hypothetical protein
VIGEGVKFHIFLFRFLFSEDWYGVWITLRLTMHDIGLYIDEHLGLEAGTDDGKRCKQHDEDEDRIRIQ